MRMQVTFDVNMPDEVVQQLLDSAGMELDEADIPLALALAAVATFPAQAREYLLSPTHTPVEPGTWTTMTTDRSSTKVRLRIDTEDNPTWKTTKK